MSTFNGKARVSVYINNSEAITELDKIDKKIKEIDRAIQKAGKKSELGKALAKDKAELQDTFNKLKQGADMSTMSIKQLEGSLRQLKGLRKIVDPTTQEFKELGKQIRTTQDRIKELQTDLNPLHATWKKVSIEAKGALAILAGGFLLNKGLDTIQFMADLSDQMSDVKRVTGMTDEQLEGFNKRLREFDTRTSQKELRDLAYEAGKLGYKSVEDVLGFVKAADQINVALGRDLGEGAILQIGKLTKVFKLKEKFGLEDSLLKIGSVINEIGASSEATEGHVVDFLNRMGGLSNVAEMTVQELAGLGGTLDSLNVSMEVSSTALNKFILKMGKDVPKFAKIAGMSVEDFKRTMDTSAIEAMLLVLEKLGEQGAGDLEKMSLLLGDLGTDGGRIVQVLGTIAGQTAEVRRQIGIANQAFEEGTSITNEYMLKNENLAGVWEKLKKDLRSVLESKTVRDIAAGFVNGLSAVINFLKRNKDAVVTFTRLIVLLTVAWAAQRLAVIAGRQALLLKEKAMQAMVMAQIILTSKVNNTTGAMKALNIMMMRNPFMAVATIVLTAASAFSLFTKKTDELTEAQKRMKDMKRDMEDSISSETVKLNMYFKALKNTTQGSKERHFWMTRINSEYGTTLKNISDENEFMKQVNKAYSEQTILIKQRAQAKFDEGKLDILTNSKNELEAQLKAVEDELAKTDMFVNKMSASGASTIKVKNDRFKELVLQQDNLKKQLAGTNQEIDKQAGKLAKVITDLEVAGSSNDSDGRRTIAVIKAEIKALNEELENTVPRSKEYFEIMKQIAKLEAELGKEEKGSGKKEKDDRLKIALKQLSEYKAASEKLWKDVLNAKTKTDEDIIQAERDKWENVLTENRQARTRIEEALQSKKINKQEKAALQIKYQELLIEEAALLQTYSKEIENLEAKLLQDRIDKRKELSAKLDEFGMSDVDKEIAQTKQAFEKIRQAALDAKDPELARRSEEVLQMEIDKIRQKFADKEKQRQKELYLQKVEQGIEYARGAEQLFSGFTQISNNTAQKELQQDKLLNDKKVENLNRQLQFKLISQDQYTQEVDKLNQQYQKKVNEARLEEAKRNQALNAFRIGIDTATSIVKTGAELGYPAAIPFQIMAGIIGAVNLGAVLSEPLPQLGKGDVIDSGRIVGGSRHSSDPSKDGNPVIDRKTGKPLFTIEEGELLLSRKFRENNPELSEALLRISQQGGRRVNVNELFGMPKPIMGMSKTFEKRRQKLSGNAPSAGSSSPSASASGNDLQSINDKIDQLMNKPIRAYLVRKDLTDMDQEDQYFKRYTEIN